MWNQFEFDRQFLRLSKRLTGYFGIILNQNDCVKCDIVCFFFVLLLVLRWHKVLANFRSEKLYQILLQGVK